jgi:hypothetical protein
MKYCRILIFILTAILSSFSFAEVKDVALWSQSYIKSLCSPVSESDQADCIALGYELVEKSLGQLSAHPSLHELRVAATSMLEQNNFRNYIARYINFNGTSEALIRQRIWQDYGVIVLPGDLKTSLGVTRNFSLEDLNLLEMGFKRLLQAISNVVGANRVREFSHIWGAGGVMAKLGSSSVGGQFGEVSQYIPAQINIVVDIKATGFTADTIAQRIAHENTHSNDYILGLLTTGVSVHWTETEDAKIFSYCGLPAGWDTSLMDCLKKHPTWFNFHYSEYSARNSAEFYGKMVDAWVREALGLSQKIYRCQNNSTRDFWNEMQSHFIGEAVLSSCNK